MKTQLRKDEIKVLQTRPHWCTLIIPCLIMIIVSVTGFIIGSYAIIISFISIGYFIYKIAERHNNIWVVTSMRVIDEYGVFSNNTKESPLDKINNVSYSQSFLGKIFSFGNVQIQTAAEIGSTTYYTVEDPKKLKDTITNMQEEYKGYQLKKQAAELAGSILAGQQNNRTDISSELERLYDLKQRGILTEEEYNNRKEKILKS